MVFTNDVSHRVQLYALDTHCEQNIVIFTACNHFIQFRSLYKVLHTLNKPVVDWCTPLPLLQFQNKPLTVPAFNWKMTSVVRPNVTAVDGNIVTSLVVCLPRLQTGD